MIQSDTERLRTTHGETGDRPVFAVWQRSEIHVNKVNQIAGNYAIEGRILVVHEVACYLGDRRRFFAGARWAGWVEFRPGQSILIHDDHWLGLPGRDQVVENEVFTPLVTPTGFVFAVSVLKIEDWVALAAGIVSRWRIDENPSRFPGHL